MNKADLTISLGGSLMNFSEPKIMGILNVTPDSFFAGSRKQSEDEIRDRVKEIQTQGADIIDIGGYSSRPGADEVSAEEEYRRLETGLRVIRDLAPDAVVSVDTFRADVARRCVTEWGVQIVNDISGGYLDPDMWATVAELKCAYVLMHMRGTPSTMQSLTDYDDVTADVISDLAHKVDALHKLGVANIILDPGFGFAKDVEQNYRMMNQLEEFSRLGLPVLVGISRKTMIWKPLGITPDESLSGTVVLDTVAMMKGADIIRVHDVLPAVQTRKILSLINGK